MKEIIKKCFDMFFTWWIFPISIIIILSCGYIDAIIFRRPFISYAKFCAVEFAVFLIGYYMGYISRKYFYDEKHTREK